MIETTFTPLISLAGGGLIGLASVLLMAVRGRIFGATGLLAATAFTRPTSDNAWRWALLAGMVSGPAAVAIVTGNLPEITVPVSLPMLLVGGVLVGIGVTFGSGCTSGHGVCGLARFSVRSLVATVTFMVATFITVFVVRHVVGV